MVSEIIRDLIKYDFDEVDILCGGLLMGAKMKNADFQ